MTKEERELIVERMAVWRGDWPLFAREILMVHLDEEQENILRSVQVNPRTSVASGTARGKDFISAVAAFCFMYLTPEWDEDGHMTKNTKVALTAPTGRQVTNIMVPEISRLWHRARRNGFPAVGRLVSNDIRTSNEEWFLTGFKADDHSTEAWTGFHAVNTMFVVTEASGMAELVFDGIEGNLQGNSRLLIVFNPNVTTGYAARSQRRAGWAKFRLNSLNAPNVIAKEDLIPGQVDYRWVKEKVEIWANPIHEQEVLAEENDFQWEGRWYRPNDLFRVKVLGVFPKVDVGVLIPREWIELANERWRDLYERNHHNRIYPSGLRLGCDIAGMGRDNTVEVHRYDNVVEKFHRTNSGGKADHMATAGRILHELYRDSRAIAIIDTIGEGAGVYSRLVEEGMELRAFSCKYSEAAKDAGERELTDSTGQYKFLNKRAYLHWMVREWLDPKNGHNPALPPDDEFFEEATEIKWFFNSNGKVQIEKKDELVERLKRSPDTFDALANTFDIVDISFLTGSNLGLLSNLL